MRSVGVPDHTQGVWTAKEGAVQTSGGTALQEVGISHAKAHGQDWAWLGGRARQLGWLVQSEQGGDGEEGRAEGTGQVMLPPGSQAERHREPQGAVGTW